MRYLLDTHAIIWLLTSEGRRIPKHLRDSVAYCEDSFFVSDLSLIEIVQLQQRSRIEFKYRPNATRSIIEENNIDVVMPTDDILECFFDLPIPSLAGKLHSDPFDRIIIATAIRRNMTLVSADGKFPWYAEHCGLNLLALPL